MLGERMRMPFERLMELLAGLSADERDVSFGELAQRWGEPAERITDAASALQVLAGERTYISAVEVRAQTDPVVRKALKQDRRGVASGCSG
jgi:hypothetical protein